MKKLENLLDKSLSFSNREKYLIYNIVKYNPEKYEDIINILKEEEKRIEKIKNNFLKKITDNSVFFVKYLQKLKSNEELKSFENKNNFINYLREKEKKEKEEENLEIEKLFN